MLKPAFGAGSMLIFRIESLEELRRHYEEATSRYSQTELLRGVQPRFDLEQVIESENWHGDDRFAGYGSVEALMFEGEFFPLAVSDRTPLLPPFRETGLMLPSSLPAERQDEMIAMARAAAEAAGATNGALHIELMMTPTGPWVIEINGRLGGSIPYIFSEITDMPCSARSPRSPSASGRSRAPSSTASAACSTATRRPGRARSSASSGSTR